MTTESNTDWRERALRAEAELRRLSFVAGNIGIEHPEWPPEYGRHLAALSSSLASVTAQRDAAVAALRESSITFDRIGEALASLQEHDPDGDWNEPADCVRREAKFVRDFLSSLDTEGDPNAG